MAIKTQADVTPTLVPTQQQSARAHHPRRPSFFDSVGMGEMMQLHAVGMPAMGSGSMEVIEHDFEE